MQDDDAICRQCMHPLSEGVPCARSDGFCSDTCERLYDEQLGESRRAEQRIEMARGCGK